MPFQVKFDPTISLGNIGSVVLVGLMAIAAYYDLRSDVRDIKTTAQLKEELQHERDKNQDFKIDVVTGDVLELKRAWPNSKPDPRIAR